MKFGKRGQGGAAAATGAEAAADAAATPPPVPPPVTETIAQPAPESLAQPVAEQEPAWEPDGEELPIEHVEPAVEGEAYEVPADEPVEALDVHHHEPAEAMPFPVAEQPVAVVSDSGSYAPPVTTLGDSGEAFASGHAAAPGPSWQEPVMELANERPELVVAAAFAGGLLAAMILRRLGN